MADSQQQLHATMTHIEHLHRELGTEFANLDHLLTADHPGTADADAERAASDLAAKVAALNTATGELTTDFSGKLHDAYETLAKSATQTQQHIEEQTALWMHADEALKAALTALDARTGESTHAIVADLDELKAGCAAALHTVQDLLTHLEESAVQTQHAVSETCASTLGKAAQAYHDGVSAVLKTSAAQHLTSAYQHAGQALTNLGQTAEHVTQHFGSDASEALHAFATGVTDDIVAHLEKTGEHLAADAMDALATIVATAIVESVAGASVTGAMSPVLPEIIVAKEAVPVIKDLVDVYKTLSLGIL